MFFSDIHADVDALNKLLSLTAHPAFTGRFGDVGRYVSLGDAMERGYRPRECVDRLKSVKGLISVLGNHDEAFLGNITVSGRDARSTQAHDLYRREGGYQEYFRGMGKYYVDRKDRLFAVHGGPVDPCLVTPEFASPTEAWLHTQTWQRISETNRPYLDNSGYHYTPAAAFDSLCTTFDGGFLIVCGHEHREAAYMQKDGYVRDIYEGLERKEIQAGVVRVAEKVVPIEADSSYLIRVGIAGPEAYLERYGWDRIHLGVLWGDQKDRAFSLLSFVR